MSLLGVLFLATACSIDTKPCTDVNQDSIYQDLDISYDGDDDTTGVTATFRFGGSTGTTLELVGSCNVTHSLYTMTKNSITILGTNYTGEGSGYQAEHTFVFTDSAGATLTNSFTNETVLEFTAPSSISKTTGGSITFTPALGSSQSITVNVQLVTSTETGSSSTLVSAGTQDADGATSVALDTSQLEKISETGSAKIWLRRLETASLTEAKSDGGQISYSYRTAGQTFDLTD